MDCLCGIELGVWQLEFLGGTMDGEGGLCVGELVNCTLAHLNFMQRESGMIERGEIVIS